MSVACTAADILKGGAYLKANGGADGEDEESVEVSCAADPPKPAMWHKWDVCGMGLRKDLSPKGGGSRGGVARGHFKPDATTEVLKPIADVAETEKGEGACERGGVVRGVGAGEPHRPSPGYEHAECLKGVGSGVEVQGKQGEDGGGAVGQEHAGWCDI